MGTVGETLGRYTLVRRLAGGGMGEVFVAAVEGAAGFGKPVALKTLRPEFASDTTFVQMLIDEAKISQFLNHQNIVSVLDFGEDKGTYYLAMEFVQGVTVERIVELTRQTQRRLDLPLALYIGVELSKALKYAHAKTNDAGEPLNIIHRDVTPANVLLSVQGEVKLTDFGIAKAQGRLHQTQAGVVKGKFGYLAPEMTRYEQIDARADLFSFGVLLYQMCAGIHPVAGASVMEAIFRYEEKQIRKPSELNPEVGGALDAVIMRALEPKPEKRWASAQALGAALSDVAMAKPEWRRGLQHAPQMLADLIRELAPEVLKDPLALPREPAPSAWSASPKPQPQPRPANGAEARGGAAGPSGSRGRGGPQITVTPVAKPRAPSEPAVSEQATVEMAAVSAAMLEDLAPSPPARVNNRPKSGPPRARLDDTNQTLLDGEVGDELPGELAALIRDPEPVTSTAPSVPVGGADTAFGATTLADPSFRALPGPDEELVVPADLDPGGDDEGFEPTRLRGGVQAATAPLDPPLRAADPASAGAPMTVGRDGATPARSSDRPEWAASSLAVAGPSGFGGNTDMWIAGKLDGKELSWSDEDAARRAIATRHLARGPASPAPTPFSAPPQSGAPYAAAPQGALAFGSPAGPYNAPAPFPAAPLPPPPIVRGTPLSPPEVALGAVAAPPSRRIAIAATALVVVALAVLVVVFVVPRLSPPVLQIATVPSGAKVTLDGKALAGATPLSLEVEPGRALQVELVLEGYEPESRELEPIDRGQTFAFAASLERTTTEVRISPVPARLQVNGRDVGQGTSVHLAPLDPGEPVEIVATAAGYQPLELHFSKGTKVPKVVEVVLQAR